MRGCHNVVRTKLVVDHKFWNVTDVNYHVLTSLYIYSCTENKEMNLIVLISCGIFGGMEKAK